MSPKQTAIMIGAAIAGLSGVSYLSVVNSICCLGVIIGGVVAVQQYVSRTGDATLESGNGAVIGATAGAVGAALGSLVDLAFRPIGYDSWSINVRDLSESMETMPPQQAEQVEVFVQFLSDPGAGWSLLFFVAGIIIYAIVGAIGGAIGAAIFGKEKEA